MAGYRAIRFDDLEDVPWKPGLTLRPVRSQLGLRAFGAAGFVGREPGDLVVEPHTEEEGRGHQELYVVLRGAARFTLDGDSLDAPAGTLIAVEPHVRREAVATEPDTAVLALGGPPTFEPAGHEYMARVRGAVDRPQDALAAAGDTDGARIRLDEAVEREPDLRREAVSDPLLSSLF